MQNLNAMFAAPLDYHLWRWLDQHSTIASRLYEFLIINFRRSPILRINYPNLAQFLPVRPERYESLARRQLGPGFHFLQQVHVVADVSWSKSKAGLPQLHFHRGRLLTPAEDRGLSVDSLRDADLTGAVRVREFRGLKPPEWHLVADFYRLWSGDERHRATQTELTRAREIIVHHGETKAKTLIPLVVKRMRAKWPEAKTFGAVAKYLPEVSRDYDSESRHREQERAQEVERGREMEERRRREAELREATPLWDALPESERDRFRQIVLTQNPLLRGRPTLVERFALDNFVRSRTA